MKKTTYTLTLLLMISSCIISYMTIDGKEVVYETENQVVNNHIVILKECNSYNPLLILKKD